MPLSNLLNKVKTSWKLKVAIAAAILVSVFIGWKFYTRTGDYETTPVTRGTITQSVSAYGTVGSKNQATLRFQTAGKVATVNFKVGDTVQKGKVIASLDTTKLNADYQRALSDLRDAEATVDKAHDDVKGHDSDETFSQRETRTTAEAAKDKAYEAVIKARKDLNNAKIIAPFDGVISELSESIKVGVNVLTTDTITIIDQSRVKFTANVDEADYSKIKLNQKVVIKLDAFPDKEFTGTVIRIGPSVVTTSSGGTAIPVEVLLETNEPLIIGLSGDADFISAEKEKTLIVPTRSIHKENNGTYVYILKGRNPVKKQVELGIEADGITEILSGVNLKDKVITKGID